MKKTFWNKRIPTGLGVLFIAIGIALTTYLVQTGVIIIGRAAPTYTPEDVRITNITDSSFSVSYTTQEKTVGSVSFGTTENGSSIAFDDRDQQSSTPSPYTVHYITVRNLQPNTKYFFSITSNQTVFLNNETPFTTMTGKKLTESPPTQAPLAGRILFPSGHSPEAIVYLTSKNAQTISTLVKEDGSYILPLNSLRDQNLTSYVSFTDDQILTMFAVGGSLKSSVTLSPQQINPVPPVTLSSNYDFTLTTTPVSSEAAIPVGFPSFSASPLLGTKEPEIVTPKKDEGFVDDQPLLRGVASPGANVKIIIHSEETIETQVTADKNGNWTFRPKTPLSPGTHTVSIVTRDQSGILKTLTQPFIVYASGTQIALATPSVSPIPSTTLTPTPQQSITATPQNTPTPTIFPTNTPMPTLPISISPTPIIQAPGSTAVQIGGIAGLSAIIIGFFLFRITRKGIL